MFHCQRLLILLNCSLKRFKSNIYGKIINVLEEIGFLVFSYAEKVEKELFAIRLTGLKNIRVFYMYFKDNHIYGIHAYEKKTRKIPDGELKKARKILKLLRFPNE